jgi:epoxide hydrolase-like predicted phosphatase
MANNSRLLIWLWRLIPVSKQIRAVLFDFGGVFTDSPFEAVDAHGQSLGAQPGQINEIVFGGYHQDGEHPWHRLERGELSLEQAREDILLLGREHELEVDIYEVFTAMSKNGGGLRQAMVDYPASLRPAGYVTGIITNNIAEIRDAWRSMLPVDDLFDFVVDSSEVGMRKPDPAIFHHALETAGVSAAQAIFLDDFAGNVEAAAELGMATVHVGTDVDQVIRELEALLN